MMSKGIEERAKFDKIRYANCWEDPELLIEVFANGGKFISIASAGDNSLSLPSRPITNLLKKTLNKALNRQLFQVLS